MPYPHTWTNVSAPTAGSRSLTIYLHEWLQSEHYPANPCLAARRWAIVTQLQREIQENYGTMTQVGVAKWFALFASAARVTSLLNTSRGSSAYLNRVQASTSNRAGQVAGRMAIGCVRRTIRLSAPCETRAEIVTCWQATDFRNQQVSQTGPFLPPHKKTARTIPVEIGRPDWKAAFPAEVG